MDSKQTKKERLESHTAGMSPPNSGQQLTGVSIAWVNVAASNLTLLPDNNTYFSAIQEHRTCADA